MKQSILFMVVLSCLSCRSGKQNSLAFPEGGYSYAANISAGDSTSYLYPLRNIISKKDSVRSAFHYSQFFPAFDEPNLSLRPPLKPVFRLAYDAPFIGYYAVLTLKEEQIIVKEKVKSGPASYADPKSANLDSIEKKRLFLLQNWFPLNEYKGKPWRKRYFDSLINAFPQLDEPRYYLSLMNKAKVNQDSPFVYRKWIVPISATTFRAFVDTINQSEFWHLPFIDKTCVGESTDADDFTFEAATPSKYQMVVSTPCVTPTKLQQVCWQLMNTSGLTQSMKKYEEDAIKRARASIQ